MLHQFPVLGSQGLEIRLYFLAEELGIGDEGHFLHVHFRHDEVLHAFHLFLEVFVQGGQHDFLQGLAYFEVLLLAQREHQGADFLCQLHPFFQVFVHHFGMVGREIAEVDREGVFLAGHGVEVVVQAVGKEGRDGRHQLGQGDKAGVQGLVGRGLVLALPAFPETPAAETHVPVAEPFIHKGLHQACRPGRLVLVKGFVHFLDQGVEFGEDPAVDFGPAAVVYVVFLIVEAIDIGIQGKEAVGVVQCSEELALYFHNAFFIEFEVVPRLGVADHVPAGGIRAVFFEGLERIHGVAQTFGHLVAVLVQYQAVGNHMLVGYRAEHHAGNRVQGEEPTPGLVHAFGNEVGGEVVLEFVLVLERVVQLGVRHRAAVEPNVDKVRFAEHLLARR